MSNTIFAVGRVGGAPTMRTTKKGDLQAKFRLCITDRYYDRTLGDFRDGDTSWVSVLAYRRLAEHVRDSIDKGQLVMVSGKFKISPWESENGTRHEFEITADHIGPDLAVAAVRVIPKARRDAPDAEQGRPDQPSPLASHETVGIEQGAVQDAVGAESALATVGAANDGWHVPGATADGTVDEPPF